MQTLQPDSTLQGGKYRILKTLGQGGFGITYLAIQTSLEREVAIKEFFMKDQCYRDESTSHVTLGTEGARDMASRFREKFLKEARNIAKLNHPNIVKVIDVFEGNGTAYYVMEYAQKGSLADKVKQLGRLSESVAKQYILQVADALEYIHERKMNHLDVKPGNILINDRSEAVLIDFGLSKQYDATTGSQTSTTPVGISEGYAPIEQYKKGGVGEFSPETDIYALGATFFKMLTGQTPPSASDVSEDGLPIEELQSRGVSQKVIDVISKAMESRKKDRYKSISEMVDTLLAQKEEGTITHSAVDNEATILTEAEGSNKEKKVSSEVVKLEKRALEELAETGDANAQYELAQAYSNAGEYKNAVSWYRKAAEQGQADAQYELGLCYQWGFGLKEDKKLAVSWYRKAAEQGQADAQYELGECYHWGFGLKEDKKLAVSWYRKAAEQGHAGAQYELGFCYFCGFGLKEDKKLAVSWYRKAAEQGQADAQYELGKCYQWGFGLKEDKKLAVSWYRKAAEQGQVDAQDELEEYYHCGNGVEENDELAVSWYRKAAEQGHDEAQQQLDELELDDDNVELDELELDENNALGWKALINVLGWKALTALIFVGLFVLGLLFYLTYLSL